MLIIPTLESAGQRTILENIVFVKVDASVMKLSDRFFNSWVFICLAASSGGRAVECQTWRHSPLKRDDCAVSGWMTMAPSAWGWDRLECRRRWPSGRLQSLELVLCECSSSEGRCSAALHPTIPADHWTAAKRKNEQRCSSSKIWCKMLINKHWPLWRQNQLMSLSTTSSMSQIAHRADSFVSR